MMAKRVRTSVTKLFDEDEIARQVEHLAGEIARAMGTEQVVVGILKGSFVFLADLIRALDRAGCRPRIEFLHLRSYGLGKETSGAVRLIGEVPEVAGRAVLLVDDVADTGLSLARAKTLLEEAGASEVRTCALVDKPTQRRVDLDLDFVGFTVGDRFVVGYGIDYAERYRHLPYIGTID
jgi:hypoxanthine phosphoribosyltransferase